MLPVFCGAQNSTGHDQNEVPVMSGGPVGPQLMDLIIHGFRYPMEGPDTRFRSNLYISVVKMIVSNTVIWKRTVKQIIFIPSIRLKLVVKCILGSLKGRDLLII